jgi:hypothetical protein
MTKRDDDDADEMIACDDLHNFNNSKVIGSLSSYLGMFSALMDVDNTHHHHGSLLSPPLFAQRHQNREPVNVVTSALSILQSYCLPSVLLSILGIFPLFSLTLGLVLTFYPQSTQHYSARHAGMAFSPPWDY